MIARRALIFILGLIPVVGVVIMRRQRLASGIVDPTAMIPADSALVLLLDTPRAWEHVQPLTQRESWARALLDSLRADLQVDFERDIAPWAGRAAFFVDVTNSFSPLVAGVLATREARAGAEAVLRVRQAHEARGARFRETRAGGVAIQSTQFPLSAPLGPRSALQGGIAYAQAGGCVLIGNTELAVRAALETWKREGRRPLRETEEWKSMRAGAPPHAPLLIAADAGALLDKYAPLLPLALKGDGSPRSPKDWRRDVDRYRAFGWFGLAVEPERGRVQATLSAGTRPGPLRNALLRVKSPAVADGSRFVPTSALGWLAERTGNCPHVLLSGVLSAWLRDALSAAEECDGSDRMFEALSGTRITCLVAAGRQFPPDVLFVFRGDKADELDAQWRNWRKLLKHGGASFVPAGIAKVERAGLPPKRMAEALRQLHSGVAARLAVAIEAGRYRELLVARFDDWRSDGSVGLVATSEGAMAAALKAAHVSDGSVGQEARASRQNPIESALVGHIDAQALGDYLGASTAAFLPVASARTVAKPVRTVNTHLRRRGHAVVATFDFGGDLSQTWDLLNAAEAPLGLLGFSGGPLQGWSAVMNAAMGTGEVGTTLINGQSLPRDLLPRAALPPIVRPPEVSPRSPGFGGGAMMAR